MVVYVAIIGVIIVMAVLGLKNTGPSLDSVLMERQMGMMRSSLGIMQSGYARDLTDPNAPPGTSRSFKLELPGSLEYISFGADPDPDNNGILTDTPPGLVTDDGNMIYYKLKGIGKIPVKLDESVHLREGRMNNGHWIPTKVDGHFQALVITGSTQSLSFELVSDNGRVYTLSHLSDDLNIYIDPSVTGALAHGLSIYTASDSVPADNVTVSRVIVQVIDSTGNWVREEDRPIDLLSTRGNLSQTKLITGPAGSSSALISSGEVGLSIITATSPGLHEGTAEVAFTLPPVFVEFNRWIMDDSELTICFQISHAATYEVMFSARGTEAHWPFMPAGWPTAKIKVDGMILGEKEINSTTMISVQYPEIMLNKGNHTLTASMTNDINVPLLGDRNLYAGRIQFY